ncbi:MAG: hypothetical protein BWY09_01683 [Candidatus Hydrogenedentes bacterium ADurb.Bin179]|nr:MAG: hypothetical protein BWY09_01683 [Candidatus Hydrogenedentes bacterium ADurb.Bin179]
MHDVKAMYYCGRKYKYSAPYPFFPRQQRQDEARLKREDIVDLPSSDSKH